MRGVRYVPERSAKKPYRAMICINGKNTSIGYYPTEAEAAEAFEKARKENPPKKGGTPKGTPRFKY